MEILNGVLKEELDRLRKLKKSYEKKIAKLPKGCLIRKKIKGHVYYYLNYREGEKGVFKYLGKLSRNKLEELLNQIDERNKLQKFYFQVKKDIKKIEKTTNEQKK